MCSLMPYCGTLPQAPASIQVVQLLTAQVTIGWLGLRAPRASKATIIDDDARTGDDPEDLEVQNRRLE